MSKDDEQAEEISEDDDGAASVESLLAQVRTLRRVIKLLVVVCVVTAAVLVFWARRVPAEVRARGFVLMDEQGERAAELVVGDDGKTVRLAMYREGVRRVELSADATRSFLRLAHRTDEKYESPGQPNMNHIELSVTGDEVKSQFVFGHIGLIEASSNSDHSATVWKHRNGERGSLGTVPESAVTIRADARGALVSTYPERVEAPE
jgi:hypothetical protein